MVTIRVIDLISKSMSDAAGISQALSDLAGRLRAVSLDAENIPSTAYWGLIYSLHAPRTLRNRESVWISATLVIFLMFHM